jgi:hypothetical protein
MNEKPKPRFGVYQPLVGGVILIIGLLIAFLLTQPILDSLDPSMTRQLKATATTYKTEVLLGGGFFIFAIVTTIGYLLVAIIAGPDPRDKANKRPLPPRRTDPNKRKYLE